MIVEDPEAEMRDRWIEGLSKEGFQVGDRVPCPQIAEALRKRMIATDVLVVRVEELPRDPDGEMAVQQISEVIGAASLVREDDESLSPVRSIHDVPHPVRSEGKRGRDESLSRVRSIHDIPHPVRSNGQRGRPDSGVTTKVSYLEVIILRPAS
jgi:hypothetical protein